MLTGCTCKCAQCAESHKELDKERVSDIRVPYSKVKRFRVYSVQWYSVKKIF